LWLGHRITLALAWESSFSDSGQCGYALDADLDALDPSVIVMLGEQQAVFPPLPDHVAKLYALTPAEARLAAALLGGRTLAEYAEAAQLSVGTTRQYLKSIFQKTGTRRQAGLIATLLADPVLRFANAR
jgi:DNA-binding CsgD family transcriptional regulator